MLDASARDPASCPYPRPDGYATDVSPFSSLDLSFSPATIASSVDDIELRARMSELADDNSAADQSDGATDKPSGLSASLKGMLLLNLGAALFGSNMVSPFVFASTSLMREHDILFLANTLCQRMFYRSSNLRTASCLSGRSRMLGASDVSSC